MLHTYMVHILKYYETFYSDLIKQTKLMFIGVLVRPWLVAPGGVEACRQDQDHHKQTANWSTLRWEYQRTFDQGCGFGLLTTGYGSLYRSGKPLKNASK